MIVNYINLLIELDDAIINTYIKVINVIIIYIISYLMMLLENSVLYS